MEKVLEIIMLPSRSTKPFFWSIIKSCEEIDEEQFCELKITADARATAAYDKYRSFKWTNENWKGYERQELYLLSDIAPTEGATILVPMRDRTGQVVKVRDDGQCEVRLTGDTDMTVVYNLSECRTILASTDWDIKDTNNVVSISSPDASRFITSKIPTTHVAVDINEDGTIPTWYNNEARLKFLKHGMSIMEVAETMAYYKYDRDVYHYLPLAEYSKLIAEEVHKILSFLKQEKWLYV